MLQRYLSLVVVVAALCAGAVAAAVASGATRGTGHPAETGTNGFQTISIPPPPVTGPRGKARVSRIVVTHRGVNVTASCTGVTSAVCVLDFQLSGGVSQGYAASMTRTMVLGTHVFDLKLNAAALAKLREYQSFYAYLKVLQTNATHGQVLVGRSFQMTAG